MYIHLKQLKYTKIVIFIFYIPLFLSYQYTINATHGMRSALQFIIGLSICIGLEIFLRRGQRIIIRPEGMVFTQLFIIQTAILKWTDMDYLDEKYISVDEGEAVRIMGFSGGGKMPVNKEFSGPVLQIHCKNIDLTTIYLKQIVELKTLFAGIQTYFPNDYCKAFLALLDEPKASLQSLLWKIYLIIYPIWVGVSIYGWIKLGN